MGRLVLVLHGGLWKSLSLSVPGWLRAAIREGRRTLKRLGYPDHNQKVQRARETSVREAAAEVGGKETAEHHGRP